MRKIRISRLTTCVWSLLIVNIVLVLLFAGWQFSAQNIFWLLGLSLWWLLSFGIIATLLPMLYRSYLDRWWLWTLLLGLCLLGGLIGQDVIHLPSKGVVLLGLFFFSYGAWTLVVSLIIRLITTDIGLPVIAWMSLGCVWGMLVLWRIQGALFEPAFQFMASGGSSQASGIWWYGMFTSAACCLIPTAILSIAGHTLVLLRREVYRLPPPHTTEQKQSAAGKV